MLERPAQHGQSGQRRVPVDFQEHLANLEAAGLVVRIDREINKDTELHPLVRWQFQRRPCRGRSGAPSCSPMWSGADGRRFDIPVAVGALSASARIYALGMGRPVEEIGRAWTEAIAASAAAGHRSASAAVPGGGDRRAPISRPGNGLARLPVPVSTPGFDAAPYLTATCASPATRIPACATWAPIAPQLKANDRLGVRMASRIGGAGGYLHWQKYRARKEPMPCAIVVGCAPVVAFTGPQKLAIDQDEMAVAGALAGYADPHRPGGDASISRCRPTPRS